MATALISSENYLAHDTGEHPERAARYTAVLSGLKQDQGIWEELRQCGPREAADEDILRCHSPETIDQLQAACAGSQNSRAALDADTIVSSASARVARLAAGGVCLAVDQVMSPGIDRAFVACRPPGHHATLTHSMGFCLYNNIAIAARYAQAWYPEIRQVLIVDFDVHHGNGTQDIFYEDPSVFYYSLHQYPWYPGTGAATERGKNAGEGYTLNMPIAPATPAKEYLRHFESGLEQIAKIFAPDLILISAGFDAHEADPLGHLLLRDEDFVVMTKRLKNWAQTACEGRLVSGLEGGYNLRTLGATVREHVRAMM